MNNETQPCPSCGDLPLNGNYVDIHSNHLKCAACTSTYPSPETKEDNLVTTTDEDLISWAGKWGDGTVPTKDPDATRHWKHSQLLAELEDLESDIRLCTQDLKDLKTQKSILQTQLRQLNKRKRVTN